MTHFEAKMLAKDSARVAISTTLIAFSLEKGGLSVRMVRTEEGAWEFPTQFRVSKNESLEECLEKTFEKSGCALAQYELLLNSDSYTKMLAINPETGDLNFRFLAITKGRREDDSAKWLSKREVFALRSGTKEIAKKAGFHEHERNGSLLSEIWNNRLLQFATDKHRCAILSLVPDINHFTAADLYRAFTAIVRVYPKYRLPDRSNFRRDYVKSWVTRKLIIPYDESGHEIDSSDSDTRIAFYKGRPKQGTKFKTSAP
jgi:hypothetical protein